MTAKDTLIIVGSIGAVSLILILFVMSVTSIHSPAVTTPAWVAIEDDVRPVYTNDGAFITMKQGQKSGPIIVIDIKPYNEVKIDLITPQPAGPIIVPVVLHTGESTHTCAWGEVILMNVTSDTAVFEITDGGSCP